jgi:hypothetical protein
MSKKDMWKFSELIKGMSEWKPEKVEKQAVVAAAAGGQSDGGPKAPPSGGVVPYGKMKQTKKPNKVIGYTKPEAAPSTKVVQKASLGRQEIDWSKPDGSPVDMLNAVQRSSRTKAMEDQGQKKEIAVFSEAQKKHKKDGGFPTR